MASVLTFKCFVGPEGTDGYFGLSAVERARKAGFTDSEIKENVEREGLKLGPKAAELLTKWNW